MPSLFIIVTDESVATSNQGSIYIIDRNWSLGRGSEKEEEAICEMVNVN